MSRLIDMIWSLSPLMSSTHLFIFTKIFAILFNQTSLNLVDIIGL